MTKDRLIEKFGGDVNHMSCCYLRDGERRLRSLLKKGMNTIIEIGTYRGVSAAVMSEYAKKVYSFDIEVQPLRRQFIDYLDIENIKFNVVKDRKQENKMIADIFDNDKVDLCFLDGEHYNGELERDFEACKECNNIIIHDYSPNFPEVYNFVNGLKGWNKEVNDTFVLLTKINKLKKPAPPERSGLVEEADSWNLPKKKTVKKKQKISKLTKKSRIMETECTKSLSI